MKAFSRSTKPAAEEQWNAVALEKSSAFPGQWLPFDLKSG